MYVLVLTIPSTYERRNVLKLNKDCVRSILLAVEDKELGMQLTLDQLKEQLPDYSLDDVHYCCLMLKEAELLDILTYNTLGSTIPQICRINELTYYGHEFLDDIRPDSTWNKVKDVASKTGASSLRALKEIAISTVTSIIQNNI